MAEDFQQLSSKKRIKKQKYRPSKKIRFDVDNTDTSKKFSLSSGEDESGDKETEDNIDWKKLEEILEESAQKANLTTINVKSILHHILRDKRVIDYAQNVAEHDGESPMPDENIVDNTKMTRAKAKLLGQQPLLSVLETPKKKSILDLEFSESSSSDEDYEPTGQDTEASQTSDDDFSEMLSDISELRSPRSVLSNTRSEALTPKLENIEEEITEVIEDSKENITTDSTLIRTPDKKQILTSSENTSLIPCVSTPSGVDLISSRTRSQYPLRDVELEELEALFQPPDFEPSLHVTNEELDDDDLIWQGWLCDLMKPAKSALNDTNDDGEDDEDFNYMAAAAEEETEIDEELRDDRATRITQKELQELFNELLLGYNRDALDYCDEIIQELCDDQSQGNKSKQRFSFPSAEMVEATKDLHISYEQRQQMTAQLQQHVQLLTQVYMLSCTHQWLREETHQCKEYIEELALFHDKAVENSQEVIGSLSAELSMFCTPGISQAYGIIKSLVGQKIITKTPKNLNKKRNLPISDTISTIFATDPYFATYIELIPKQGIQNGEVKDRVRRMKFLQCEDNLLALGLHQFKGHEKFELISQHLLPIKEPRQLRIRVKNACTMRVKYNPIAVVKKQKYLPEFENVINISIPRDVSSVPLFKLSRGVWKHRLVPDWYSKIYKSLLTREKEREAKELLVEYERKNELFSLGQKDAVITQQQTLSPSFIQPSTQNHQLLYSTPVQLKNQNSNKLFYSDPVVRSNFHQIQRPGCVSNTTVKSNIVSTNQQTSLVKQRVSRSLRYSETRVNQQGMNDETSAGHSTSSTTNPGISTPSIQDCSTSVIQDASIPAIQETSTPAIQSSTSGTNQQSNTSGDGFSLPMNVLLKDLPVPESLPHLNFSPSKPLHETSFSDVKHFLKTPQKVNNQEKEPFNKLLSLTPLKDYVGGVGSDGLLRTPQKVQMIEKDLNDSLAELSGSDHSPLKSPCIYVHESDDKQDHFKPTELSSAAVVPDCRNSPSSDHKIHLQVENPNSQTIRKTSSDISIQSLNIEKFVTETISQQQPSTNTMNSDLTKVFDKPSVTFSNSSEAPITSTTPPDSHFNTNKKEFKRNLSKKPFHVKRKKKAVFNYDERLKQRAVDFAHIYFRRVREVLIDRPDLCNAFFVLMQSVNKHLSKLETYRKLKELLCDFPELVDNYVGFLEQHEARYIGKYMEWLQFDLVIRFHLQCEQHFFGTPGHYKKITKKILEVTSRTQNSKEIVAEVVPLFQGETLLRDLFIRLFPDLSPPPCNDEDFEVIDFGAVSSGMKDIDDFEEIPYQPPDFEQSLLLIEDELPSSTFKPLPEPVLFLDQKQISFSKRRSNKSITAKKLKKLATKRKKMKQKRVRQFRASPTSGEDEYHEDDYDEFILDYSRHSGEDEDLYPTQNTDNEEERLTVQTLSKRIESSPIHADLKSDDEKAETITKQDSSREACVVSNPVPVHNEESNISIKSSENIFNILRKDALEKDKEKSLSASDLTFRSHSLSSEGITIEKTRCPPDTDKDDVPVKPVVADNVIESSADVDFNVVSTGPATQNPSEFVIDLCSVSSSTIENKSVTDITMVERVLDNVPKETAEVDTEVESIMFKKPSIPHVHFSTPKVKIFRPDADSSTGDNACQNERDVLSTISVVSSGSNDISFQDKITVCHAAKVPELEHTNISLFNELTFPEFPSTTLDADSTSQPNKSIDHQHSLTFSKELKKEANNSVHAPQVSLFNDLTFPEYPSSDKTILPSSEKSSAVLKAEIKNESKICFLLGELSNNKDLTAQNKSVEQNQVNESSFSQTYFKESPSTQKSPFSNDDTPKDISPHQSSNSSLQRKPSAVKLPRRLSAMDVVTITTDIDRSAFYSDDSMSSTISCLAPSVSPRKLKTINEMTKKKSIKKRRVRKVEVKSLSERLDKKKDFFSDEDDYFESRSVESSYDPNSNSLASPPNYEGISTKPPLHLKHSKSCPSMKKLSTNKKRQVMKRPKRRLKSNEIKTISERERKDEFSDDDDNYFQSWSVESLYDPNSSYIATIETIDKHLEPSDEKPRVKSLHGVETTKRPKELNGENSTTNSLRKVPIEDNLLELSDEKPHVKALHRVETTENSGKPTDAISQRVTPDRHVGVPSPVQGKELQFDSQEMGKGPQEEKNITKLEDVEKEESFPIVNASISTNTQTKYWTRAEDEFILITLQKLGCESEETYQELFKRFNGTRDLKEIRGRLEFLLQHLLPVDDDEDDEDSVGSDYETSSSVEEDNSP